MLVAASTRAAGRLGSGGMVNVSESLINAVIEDGPKVLTGPGQNGKEVGRASRHYALTDNGLPAERRNLNHPGI